MWQNQFSNGCCGPQHNWQGPARPFWHQRGAYRWWDSEFRESTHFNDELNQYELSIEVPGIPKDKIKVKANNEFLYVIVDNKKSDDDKPFERRYSFRQAVDLSKIKAKYNNGLLTIEVPLKESEKQDITVE